MRKFTLVFLSFILSVQSVIGAGAMAATASFVTTTTGAAVGPVPKKATTKTVNPENSPPDEDIVSPTSGDLAGQMFPYYLLGGLAVGGIIAAADAVCFLQPTFKA
jgi:hypothetical protein